jgi:hypothetical protein
LLVPNGAVIGGARNFTSVVSNKNSRAPPITAPLVTNNRCELVSTTNYCSTEITTVLELKLVNTIMVSFKACAAMLKINTNTFMTYGSPINCSTGMTSVITIEDDIVDSYIISCGDHYIKVIAETRSMH